MIIGGEWCSWCHIMEAFLETNKNIKQALLDVFVILKVNISEENDNEEFMSQLPEVRGVPHFVIAGSAGKIVGSQSTGSLERKNSYSQEAFMTFINKWRN